MNKIKILFVITKSNFGGAQRYVFDVATSLPFQNYEVVVAFGGAGVLKEKLKTAGIKTRTIKNFERTVNLRKEWGAMFELATIIREEKPDIVHLNSSKAGGTGAFVARLLRVPHIVFTAHGWAFLENRGIISKSAIWFFSWMTALLAHKVIVVSRNDEIHMHMPCVSKKTSVIHTGISPIPFLTKTEARISLFSREIIEQHKDDFWLVSTSELTPNKNLHTALTGVSEYNATRTRKIFFTLIGTGELVESLMQYVKEHQLENAIMFAGYVEDAPLYLKAFDAFILPSVKEGLPYGLLEAGLAGIPCIASHRGGIPEVIEQRTSGILVDPHTPTEIVHALSELIEQEEPIQQYTQKLQKKIATEFSLAEMLRKTERVYRS